jgi:hypothetical protein
VHQELEIDALEKIAVTVRAVAEDRPT